MKGKKEIDPELFMITRYTIYYWMHQLNKYQLENTFQAFMYLLKSVKKNTLMQLDQRKAQDLINSSYKHLMQ